ncbi:retrotransposon protein, putative, ty1-copia subclass [Tanacetum coccineum]
MIVHSKLKELCTHKGSFLLQKNECDTILWSISNVDDQDVYDIDRDLTLDLRGLARGYYTHAYTEDGVNGYLLTVYRFVLKALYDAHTEIACLMLGSMSSELHRQFELHYPYDMIQELGSMFEKQAEVEKFDLIQSFHACKQEEGKPVADYVLKMKGYVEQLERLGYALPQDVTVGLILNGLTKDFVGFVRNYNMHNMGKTIGEIHAMLIEYEKCLPKKAETPQVMMIKSGQIQKPNKKSLKAKGKNKVKGKGKDKKVYVPKPKNPKPTAMERPAKDDACHHCKEVGHWKRNCPVYLAELLKKKKQVVDASSSGIFMIELFSLPNNNSWVYDTGCSTHICNTKQGFRIEKKLKRGALYLYVGNGVREQVEAIGSYDLVLPNGLVICLDNCHYSPTIMRGVVSVSRLVDNGFVQCFTDYGISISKNNVLYFNVVARNGVYEIDMHDLVPNVNSIYNVSNKRVKRNLDSTYLWHCRLAHINKKRIKQLQQDGLLKSTDDESFDQCESCLSGKMTKKHFPHSNERAKDLLGIIHTDVCGPLRHVSRQGASYFITFTDDYSRYGYVYLLKHKHEVFETSQSGLKIKVENKLGKTIKAIRSDRGGEYISQEFKDYLKANGIVQQLTPPYTPQHNGVSERRNQSATRILNMVPTKKVDKTNDCGMAKFKLGLIMKVWGCEALVKRDTPDKLEQRSVEGFEPPQPPQEEEIPIRSTSIKARCSKGFITQLYGVDYEETFSPVADIRAIRILISIAEYYDYEIWQMDIKTAFLNGYLDEDIYMVQPEGFVDPNHPRKASGSNVAFLILYVDDIIIMGNHIPSLQSVKDYLGKCFSMKDLGETTFILGIKIYRDRSKRLIGLIQNTYMDKILKRYRMDNSKRGTIPMQEKLDLNKSQGAQTPKEVNRMKNVPYASANPGELHWTAVKNILKYLRILKICSWFMVEILAQNLELNAIVMLDSSSKQSTIAMSATESEYIAASEAAMEAVWIRKFILGLVDSPELFPCKSALFDGCRFALALRKMEKESMWKVMSQVWIEMLAFAATLCRGFHHEEQLKKRGRDFDSCLAIEDTFGHHRAGVSRSC